MYELNNNNHKQQRKKLKKNAVFCLFLRISKNSRAFQLCRRLIVLSTSIYFEPLVSEMTYLGDIDKVLI